MLSLNAHSLPAKIDGVQAMLELFASQHIYFPVICIQETWIDDESKLSMVSIEGYEYFYVKQSSSSHGGVITYVDNTYEVSVLKKINTSNVWEGLFLELNRESIKKQNNRG